MSLMGSLGSVGLMGCWGLMGSWVSLGSLGSVGSVGSCGVIGVNGAMWDHWGQWSYGVHVRSLGSLGQRSQWGQWGHLGKGRIALFLGHSTPWPGAAQTLGLHFLLGTHTCCDSPAGFCRVCGFLLGSSSSSSATAPQRHYCLLWYRTGRCLSVHEPGLPASHQQLLLQSCWDTVHFQHQQAYKAEKGNVGLMQMQEPKAVPPTRIAALESQLQLQPLSESKQAPYMKGDL